MSFKVSIDERILRYFKRPIARETFPFMFSIWHFHVRLLSIWRPRYHFVHLRSKIDAAAPSVEKSENHENYNTEILVVTFLFSLLSDG